MNTQLDIAKDTLYGRDGLGATNFKLFPGTNREATAEDLAGAINNSINSFIDGDISVVSIDSMSDDEDFE